MSAPEFELPSFGECEHAVHVGEETALQHFLHWYGELSLPFMSLKAREIFRIDLTVAIREILAAAPDIATPEPDPMRVEVRLEWRYNALFEHDELFAGGYRMGNVRRVFEGPHWLCVPTWAEAAIYHTESDARAALLSAVKAALTGGSKP